MIDAVSATIFNSVRQKTVPARIPEDFFFPAFPEEFFTGTWFWRGCRNSCFFHFYRNFSQEFLWGGIPVPAKSCWLWSATKECSL